MSEFIERRRHPGRLAAHAEIAGLKAEVAHLSASSKPEADIRSAALEEAAKICDFSATWAKGEADDESNSDAMRKDYTERKFQAIESARSIRELKGLPFPAAGVQVAPDGFALVPLRMSREMRRVTDEEGWQWEDLLSAAEAITDDQYNEIAAAPALSERAPSDLSAQLREYAGNPGYSHGDYADTMRQAANEIERLNTAKSHIIRQAQMWRAEAKGQRATVISILRRLGLPENDWEAKRLIVHHIAKLTGAPVPRIAATELAGGASGSPPEPALRNGATVLADDEIHAIARKAYTEGRMGWAGFSQDKDGFYTAPVLSKNECDLARAVQSEVASRFRAQGGNTSEESAGQVAIEAGSVGDGLTDAQKEAMRDALSATLGDAMDCTRVWSAWGVGTMSEDDFQLLADNDERLEELVEAVEKAIAGQSGKDGEQHDAG